MNTSAPSTLSPFAQHLVDAGLLVEAQANELANQARSDEIPLSIYLEKNKWVNPTDLAMAAAELYALPVYDLLAHQPQTIPTNLLTLEPVQKGYVIPLKKHKDTITFGVVDMESVDLNEIAFTTGSKINSIIVESDKLRRLLEDLNEAHEIGGIRDIDNFDLALSNTLSLSDEQLTKGSDQEEHAETNTSIISYVNKLIVDAINKNASDIHFEPFEKNYRIRYRIDGILYEVDKSSANIMPAVVTRLKILANLDIAERRIPQDGRFKLEFNNSKSVDFRINTCPTLYGEKVVIRILDSSSILLKPDQLGMTDEQMNMYLEAIHLPQGIILVTGPTGSGKTISLYTAIKQLNSVQKNICTVEDPIEIYMEGINQVHMNTKTGMTFAKAMRAFLRQDPDIIMVGEIRDLETADIAIKAAETGHLVLSTLHTNNTPMTLTRLTNIGVNNYNVASSISLIIAQRLLRKLCDQCKRTIKIDADILMKQGFSENEIEDLKLFGPGQCSKCSNGYSGRTGVFEVMSISDKMRSLIMHNKDTLQLTAQAKKEGMQTLRESGLLKVKAGITSLDELNRVISVGT